MTSQNHRIDFKRYFCTAGKRTVCICLNHSGVGTEQEAAIERRNYLVLCKQQKLGQGLTEAGEDFFKIAREKTVSSSKLPT